MGKEVEIWTKSRMLRHKRERMLMNAMQAIGILWIFLFEHHALLTPFRIDISSGR
jgi:hypothetical protein